MPEEHSSVDISCCAPRGNSHGAVAARGAWRATGETAGIAVRRHRVGQLGSDRTGVDLLTLDANGLNVRIRTRTRHQSRVIGCLYMSMVTMSTLGFGDFVPTSARLRIVTPLEASFGFAPSPSRCQGYCRFIRR